MKELARISVLLTVVAICAWPSRANLIALDSSFGPGTLIEDTDTQLEWLKLTVTQGQSMGEVTSELGAGQEFAGFRFARIVEVGQLFFDSGLTSIIPSDSAPWGDQVGLSQNPSDLAPATHLINLFGQTSTNGGTGIESAGYVANRGDFSPPEPLDAVEVGVLFIQNTLACSAVPCVTASPLSGAGPDGESPEIGSFLVRSAPAAVPEPSTMVLMPTGLALLAVMRGLRCRARAKVLRGNQL